MSDRRQDPWADMPRWSDDEAASAPGGTTAAPEPEAPEPEVPEPATPSPAPSQGPSQASSACPWCATPAAEGATRCGSCGAALAQRESIGDLVVPGLTAVDPALKDLDGRPLHLRGPSPSQGVASGIVVAAGAGGPIGLTILGGVAAVAAAEYLGAGDAGAGTAPEHVGEASGAVLQAIERLERGEALPAAGETTPRPELATGAQSANREPASSEAARQEEAGDGD